MSFSMGCSLLMAIAGAAPALAGGPHPGHEASAARVRKLLEELVAVDTENPPGNEARAAAIGAARLRAAGISHQVYEFAPGRANLVARLQGDGPEAPVLLLAHIDVVPTQGQAWMTPPHRVSERDGWLFGRGVADDLREAAAGLEVLLLLKEKGIRLRRDVIVAWTGDEERGGAGLRWQLEHHPETLANAGVAITEGADVGADDQGRPTGAGFNVAEKAIQTFTLRARGGGGHSSKPLATAAGNPLVRVARAVGRVADHRFAPRLLPTVRTQLAEAPAPESPVLAAAVKELAAADAGQLPAVAVTALDADPALAALLRTTCAVTMFSAGTAFNALPSEATAKVNCRILPDEGADQVERQLKSAIADPEVEVIPEPGFCAGASPVTGEGPAAIRAAMARLYPGITVAPLLAVYATDARFLRARGMPVYGFHPSHLRPAPVPSTAPTRRSWPPPWDRASRSCSRSCSSSPRIAGKPPCQRLVSDGESCPSHGHGGR
jgi:acetylornithine deacetylase/succinyl-diaminopimelate desuccinylase-like protein